MSEKKLWDLDDLKDRETLEDFNVWFMKNYLLEVSK